MHRTTRFRITDINKHLICVLCQGYLIDASTIIECLHSFCRSCIVRYLESSKYCPICDVQIHKTKPLLNIRLDRTLQDIVYKLVPGLFKDEMKQRKTFYEEHPEGVFDTLKKEDLGEVDERHKIYTEDEKISICVEHCEKLPPHCGATTLPAGVQDLKDQGEKRFLLCPAVFTVGLLKKFIRVKYDLKEKYQIEVFHSDDCLKDDFTLMDIAYIYCWRRSEPLKFYYLVFDKSKVSLDFTAMESDTASIQSNDTNSITHSKKRKKVDIPRRKYVHLINGLGDDRDTSSRRGSLSCNTPEKRASPEDRLRHPLAQNLSKELDDSSQGSSSVGLKAGETREQSGACKSENKHKPQFDADTLSSQLMFTDSSSDEDDAGSSPEQKRVKHCDDAELNLNKIAELIHTIDTETESMASGRSTSSKEKQRKQVAKLKKGKKGAKSVKPVCDDKKEDEAEFQHTEIKPIVICPIEDRDLGTLPNINICTGSNGPEAYVSPPAVMPISSESFSNQPVFTSSPNHASVSTTRTFTKPSSLCSANDLKDSPLFRVEPIATLENFHNPNLTSNPSLISPERSTAEIAVKLLSSKVSGKTNRNSKQKKDPNAASKKGKKKATVQSISGRPSVQQLLDLTKVAASLSGKGVSFAGCLSAPNPVKNITAEGKTMLMAYSGKEQDNTGTGNDDKDDVLAQVDNVQDGALVIDESDQERDVMKQEEVHDHKTLELVNPKSEPKAFFHNVTPLYATPIMSPAIQPPVPSGMVALQQFNPSQNISNNVITPARAAPLLTQSEKEDPVKSIVKKIKNREVTWDMIVQNLKRKRGRPPKDHNKILARFRAQHSPLKLMPILPKGAPPDAVPSGGTRTQVADAKPAVKTKPRTADNKYRQLSIDSQIPGAFVVQGPPFLPQVNITPMSNSFASPYTNFQPTVQQLQTMQLLGATTNLGTYQFQALPAAVNTNPVVEQNAQPVSNNTMTDQNCGASPPPIYITPRNSQT